MSRINKLYTRKSKEDLDDTPTGRNLFRSIEELERDITFVEDDGKYRIVSSQASKSGNNFNFKFMKNLFEEDDGKLFNFDSYEPNMFDFTRMKDN